MITRMKYPTTHDFEEVLLEGQPVVFECPAWAPGNMKLDALKEVLRDKLVRPVVQNTPRLEWDPDKGLSTKEMPFSHFAEEVEYGRWAQTWAYLQEDIEKFPDLAKFSELPLVFSDHCTRNILRRKLWISGPDLVTPLHYDPVETLHWLREGIKEFVLYPPGVRNYYPHPITSTAPFISQIDPSKKVDWARYPRFKKALPETLYFNLNAGEWLYLPAFWWHEVTSLGNYNLSVNYVWWASMARNLACLPQLGRSARHLLKQLWK